MTLIIDASGLTISNKKGDYYIAKRNRYLGKRSLSSCHISVDEESKKIDQDQSFRIRKENVHMIQKV